jgi:hypothetical protein
MENNQAVTCQIRYTLDPEKLTAFETYARTWVSLIERYGVSITGISYPGRVQTE